MKELTALEKTIWNLAMTGGSVKYYDDERELLLNCRIVNICHEEITITDGEYQYDVSFDKVTPILHSLNKLTETVLEGSKVPIVELFKICMQNNYLPSNFFKKEKPIFYIEEDAVNFKIGEFTFGFDLLDNSFVLVLEDNILTVFNQKQLFDQLRQWDFNIENLNPDEFIEKSTLKIEK